jgi:hypothetical protein
MREERPQWNTRRLSSLRAEIPSPLVSAASFHAIENVAAQLPEPSGEIVLELRLATQCHRVDLTVVYFREDLRSLGEIEPSSLNLPLRSFYDDWQQAQSACREIPSIAFECDIAEETRSSFVYPYVQTEHHRGLEAVAAARQVELVEDQQPSSLTLAENFLARHAPALADTPWRDHLRRAFAALPRAAFLFYVATMERRPSDAKQAVRILLSLPKSDLAAYLHQIQWPGDFDWLERTLEVFFNDQGRINFDLNLGSEGTLDRIGLFRDFLLISAHDRRRQSFEENLLVQGIADRQKIDALRSWVSSVAKQSETLARARELGYKIVYEQGRPHAKAYLTFRP